MDNIAHSLCGAALARAGLVRRGPLVTATLVVAANGPDLDALLYVFGDSIDALMHRRGWSHSLLTFFVQIPLLAWLFYFFGTRSARKRGKPLPEWRPLLLASALGYLSHVGLDLLNTYGVRFLLPFDSSWYRGDMAFIVDPWMWLLFGGATLWGGGVRPVGYLLWAVLSGLGAAVMHSRGIPLAINGGWVACMLLCMILRKAVGSRVAVARLLVVLVSLYLGGLKWSSHLARGRGIQVIRQTLGDVPIQTTVNPYPAIPWRSTLVAATEEVIYRVRVDLFEPASEEFIYHELERHLDDPALSSIAHTREYKAWRQFAKHPFVFRSGNAISLGDGRYSHGGPNGWSTFTLPLPE